MPVSSSQTISFSLSFLSHPSCHALTQKKKEPFILLFSPPHTFTHKENFFHLKNPPNLLSPLLSFIIKLKENNTRKFRIQG